VISNLNIQQPHYARVSTVRNYNGEELIQDVSAISSRFCAGMSICNNMHSI